MISLKLLFKSLRTDSLFRNAVYLIASTAVMSLLGFGFWIFVAHLYTPAEIGIASALISISSLISSLSLLGLNSGLVRFLSKSKNQSGDINAAIIAVAAGTIIIATGFMLLNLNGGIGFFGNNIWTRSLFIILMCTVSLNTLTDSVFIANRKAQYHTLGYASFGVVKLILPLFLIHLGSMGIFIAFIAAVLTSLGLSLFLMWRACGYKFNTKPNWEFMTQSKKYSLNNYGGQIFAGLPAQIMPSLIVLKLGPASAAYFSMAWAMAGILYVLPSAITNSLLAESAHDPEKHARNLKHATKILTYLLVPIVTLSMVIAANLLGLFGQEYSSGGTTIFQILAFATFSIAGNYVGTTILNFDRKTGINIAIQGLVAATTLGLTFLLMPLGLAGIGLAILAGNLSGNIAYAAVFYWRKQKSPATRLSPTDGVVVEFLGDYGLNNSIISQDLGDGDRVRTTRVTHGAHIFILKIYNAQKRSAVQILEEIKFTDSLREKGVSTPATIRNLGGASLSEKTINGTPWVGVLMTFEPGKSPTSFNLPLIKEMARIQARIHQIGQQYYEESSQHKALYGQGSALSKILSWLPKGLSHFDYHENNILVQNNSITSVLDFEGMRRDALVVCMLYTLIRMYSIQPNKENFEVYIREYQSIRQLSFSERIVLHVALSTYLIFAPIANAIGSKRPFKWLSN